MKSFKKIAGKPWGKVGKLSTLNCRYYGFECNFEINGDIEKIVQKIKQHTFEEHEVNLTKEYLTQLILRKKE
jgi:predicted small metal-binding protein